MKKFAAVVLAGGLLGLGATAHAINPGTSNVKAQVASNLSVLVTGTYDFGIVAAGSTSDATTAVTVQNDGTGVTETMRIKLANPAPWTAVAAAPAAVEEYALLAQFNTVQPLGPSWTFATMALGTADKISAATPGGNLAGDRDGFQMTYLETQNLWFRFLAPVTTTVPTQQTINLTITATTP